MEKIYKHWQKKDGDGESASIHFEYFPPASSSFDSLDAVSD
jgi:hypothetical protein